MLGQTGAFKYIPKTPDQMELTNKKVPALKGQILNQSSTRNAPSTKFPHGETIYFLPHLMLFYSNFLLHSSY